MFFPVFEDKRAAFLNPLVLAFVGDGVFSLYIREMLVEASDAKSGALHKTATRYVSAVGQARLYDGIADRLTDAERDIARRARNAHNTTKAKNTDLETYKKATSFEAVLGYLHLTGKTDRMTELIRAAIELHG